MAPGDQIASDHLIAKVKDVQRSSLDGKLKWMSYTIKCGDGKHDPKFHTDEFIEAFFELYETDQVEIDPKLRGAPGPVVGNEVFIGHLPQDVNESEISDYFTEWGEISKLEFKEGRGFAFITFKHEADVNQLIEYRDDHHIRDQWVDVKRAEDRRKGGKDGKGKGGGGYGGGKGGGKGKGPKMDSWGGGKGSWGNDSWGGGKGASKGKGGGGKGGDRSLKRVSEDEEWWSTPPSAPMNKSSGGKGGKGFSSGGGKGGKSGGKGKGGGGGYDQGGYDKHRSGGGKSGGKGGDKGKGGKGKGKRSSPY